MNGHAVTRGVVLPDRFRIERCLRLPEFGPRILFFSGGSALRKTARVLKHYTHNSTHVITAFDSGGSSAELRQVFRMPSIGDLRNRLLALADESVQGNPEVYRLFSHRLPLDEPADLLTARFDALLRGTDPLIAELPSSFGNIIRTHLRAFADRARGTRFDLRGASVGNLVLAAGYLENEEHLDSVLFLFSKLVGALGRVVAVTDEDVHLAADLADGSRIVGQHRFREATARIESVELVASLTDPRPVVVAPNPKAIRAVGEADLVCLPMGSFFSSVVANLLPPGVTRAVANAPCPRVYVPNTGVDPEQGGRSVADCVAVLLDYLAREPAPDRPAPDSSPVVAGVASPRGRAPCLDFVILDRRDDVYEVPPERERVTALGVRVLETDLVDGGRGGDINPNRLVDALVSLT